MRVYRLVLASCLITACLNACDRTHQAAQEKSVSWLSLCPDFSKTGKAVVEQNAQCGVFSVLENPQNPQGKKIPINVLLLPAVNPVPEKDPLFVVAGGPGQSAVVVAESLYSVFNDIRKNRDIVFVDQRGTGKSNPLDCELETEASQQLSESEQETFTQKAIAQCINTIKDISVFYTTPYAVADLDAVRAELGYEKINLWGGSYGTRVVLEYMRRYPIRARAGVLDGVAPVDIALPWSMETDGLAALEALNTQCAKTKACVDTYGDIVKKAKVVSDRLSQKPVAITIPHPRTQEKGVLNLSAEDFSGVIRLALYSRDLSSLIPRVISEAESGNYELFASLIYLAKSKSDLAGVSYGMHYSVVCNEDYPLYKNKNAAESNVFLNAHSVQKYSKVCEQLPLGKMSDDYWQPILSDVPALLLSGAMDPVTPPRWGELVKQRLKNAEHFVVPGGHHIVTAEGCVAQLITAFIAKANAQPLDASCVKNIQPLAIHLPVSAYATDEESNTASQDDSTTRELREQK